MNRCPAQHLRKLKRSALAAVALGALFAAPLAMADSPAEPVQTQHEAAIGGRNFPINTLRGRVGFGNFPEVELDGKVERLAPGVRIRNTQNMLVTPATLTGQYLAVNYKRDAAGLIGDMWILSPQEAGASRTSAAGEPLLNIWPFVSRASNE